ncbi:AvaI/BsoBI family type II restriction endonuclease [Spirosoma sp. 209]|uniref:AvaI/BsoBI family type II restriction endonuclease n=1 Tax=Spirosoma sp. 209 TaxID=1955701 RepID=UPI00098D2584|nr:AvaI/BsoBI family type II restriction endonuclease [Spirosoma sp. 209]
MDYKNHIKSASDLVTLRTDTSAGFIKMSLERSLRATQYVEQGRALRAATAIIPDVPTLLADPSMHEAILTAAGVSEKAKQYFLEADRQLAMSEFAEKYLQTAGSQFSDELVLRFMLTRGETLGGTMKNVVGYLAEVRLLRAVVAALTLRGQPFKYLSRDSNKWLSPQPSVPDIERNARGITWESGSNPRTLLLNVGVPQVRKNVDLCLFECAPDELSGKNKAATIGNITKYIALGELKGGIDPAGADEHWKTARSALNRIRLVFSDPAIFFVGAAIETAMSVEIWDDLESGILKNAANLNHDDQVASFVSWMINL